MCLGKNNTGIIRISYIHPEIPIQSSWGTEETVLLRSPCGSTISGLAPHLEKYLTKGGEDHLWRANRINTNLSQEITPVLLFPRGINPFWAASQYYNDTFALYQRAPVFLVPGTSFTEGNVSIDQRRRAGVEGLGMIQVRYTHAAAAELTGDAAQLVT